MTNEIAEEVVNALRSGMRGPVLLPSDPQYDEARQLWNAMIDRHPGAIARCATVDDIVHAVRVAEREGLAVSVRGAGHNIAGHALCDGGLAIDLSGMRSVQIDRDARVAHVEPGATLADLDREAQAQGLVTPTGINSTTGIAGLTLGGGFGWLTRRYGLTIDNLISAEVITADGQRRTASADESPDLFWAIRGGGGNFGIVSRFDFRLHPLGPDVLSGLVVYPFEEARSVLLQYRDYAPCLPDEVVVWSVIRKAPPLPFLPESAHGRESVIFPFVHSGNMEEGKRLLEPLRRFGTPVGELMGPTSYTAWQQSFDPLLAAGARNYWKSHNFVTLEDAAIDAICEYAGKLPSPHCEIFIGLLGGAASRVPPDATAYAHRDAQLVMNVHARWTDPAQDAECISWARDFFESTRPYATGGVYVNFMTADEGGRIADAYGVNLARLAQVKRKYDPGNLFSQNQNIKPAA